MESNQSFWIFVIVTLIPFGSCVPLRDPYVARSLLSVSPPPCDSESPSPAPAPANIVSPAASPEIPADSITPANSPSEIELVDSPAWSPDSPADSLSPANSPSESDSISPANSPSETSPASSPADSISPTSEEDPMAPSGKTLMDSPKSLLKQPLLSSSPLLSPEIKSICSKSDNAPLCESSVTPLLTPDLKPDASSVLILTIQASINATKAAMTIIDKAASPDCVELYDDAVTNLEDAINAVKSRDNPTVNTNLSAAMTDYGTCNDGFEESGEPNPLADVSGKLTKMVSNCLAISTLLK